MFGTADATPAVIKIFALFIASTPPFKFQTDAPKFVALLLMQTQPPVPPGAKLVPSTNCTVPPFWLIVQGELKAPPIDSWLTIERVAPGFTFRTANWYGRCWA